MFAIILIEMSDIFDNLLVAQIFKRLFPGERQYLPERDCERPHIAFHRVFALERKKTQRVTFRSEHKNKKPTKAKSSRDAAQKIN